MSELTIDHVKHTAYVKGNMSDLKVYLQDKTSGAVTPVKKQGDKYVFGGTELDNKRYLMAFTYSIAKINYFVRVLTGGPASEKQGVSTLSLNYFNIQSGQSAVTKNSFRTGLLTGGEAFWRSWSRGEEISGRVFINGNGTFKEAVVLGQQPKPMKRILFKGGLLVANCTNRNNITYRVGAVDFSEGDDDFTLMHGVTQKKQAKLRKFGLNTFDKLRILDPHDITLFFEEGNKKNDSAAVIKQAISVRNKSDYALALDEYQRANNLVSSNTRINKLLRSAKIGFRV